MSSSELPPDEGFDLPDLATEPGDSAPSADVDAPTGASYTDDGETLVGDVADLGFGEDTSAGDRDPVSEPAVDDSDLFGDTEDTPAARTTRSSGQGARNGTSGGVYISNVSGSNFTIGNDGIVVGEGGTVTARNMTGAEAAAFERDMQAMAADLQAMAARHGGGANTTHISSVTGPAEIVVHGERITVGAGETINDLTLVNGERVQGERDSSEDPDAADFTEAEAADAHTRLDAQLADSRRRIDEALDSATRTASSGDGEESSETAAGDPDTERHAQLEGILRTARGYQDSAFGPPAAAEEPAEAGDGQTAAEAADSDSDARDSTYYRADEEDRAILDREGLRGRSPAYSDEALQERYGRDEAQQAELRAAYAAARERYDAALAAHNDYWGHDRVEDRQAVDREMHLARDQLNYASDLLFRDSVTVYDTAFNNGGRFINGMPVTDRGETVADGDGPTVNNQTPERSLTAAPIERPHVGERFSETDRSAARSAGERARLQQLERLPHNGFTRREIAQVREQIAALGYPVDNFKVFNHKQNERGTEDTIASWLGHGYGEFTVYDLYNKMIPEKRLGTLGHETAHANSPLKPENTAAFGGEANQYEATRYIENVARQSLETGVHLNGYHKYLMNEYKGTMNSLQVSLDSGEITEAECAAAQAEAARKFKEETWAIMNEMALTNRNGLAEVEARQFKALDDLSRARGADNVPARVALISDPPSEDNPIPQTHGIDRWLITLLDGVNNQQELMQHVDTLKQRFYGAANHQKAEQRQRGQYAPAA